MKSFRFRITAAFTGTFCLLSALVFPHLLLSVPRPTSCDAASLPAEIREVLKSKFAGWRSRRLSDLDVEDQKLWLDGPSKQSCAGIAIGHFENAKELSYAFLLVPESETVHGYKIVVLSRQTNGNYASNFLDQGDENAPPRLVISKASPGKFSDFEGTKSIHTKLDSVVLEWLEAAAVLCYWSAGRYERIQTSD
jgi:hypothetical protein